MKAYIGIKNLTLKARIGCFDAEKTVEQDINIEIEGCYDIGEIIEGRNKSNHEHLSSAIDYCEFKSICEQTLKSSYSLLEILCYEIQQSILNRFSNLESLNITIKKPHAFRGEDFPYVTLIWGK